MGGLHISCGARAYLENLQPARNSKGMAKCLSQKEIEEKLDKIVQTNGESELNKLRDDAKRLAANSDFIRAHIPQSIIDIYCCE